MSSIKYPSILSSIIILFVFIGFTVVICIPFVLMSEYLDWFDLNVVNAFVYALPIIATIYFSNRKIIKDNDVKSVIDFLISRKPFPSISSSILILFMFIGFTILLGIPFVVLTEYADWLDVNIATAIAYVLPMLATIYVGYRQVKKTSYVESVFNFSLGGIQKYLFIIPLTFVMMLWVDFFASLIPMPDWAIKLFEEAFNLSIPNIIMISIFAPMLEEILVRGLVLRGYLLNYTPNKAIIASAVFFGVMHLNPWQFVAGFISGLFLGYLYYKTKSLVPSILVHFINNSLAVVFSLYYTNADASFTDMLGVESYYAIMVVSIVLGYFLFKKLDKILSIDNPTNKIDII